uniref:Uncharacterized protein n=1 Tax=Pavo cristatus TaxID=9049 RepID=A0A8C9L389_PAVCR
MLEKPAWSAVAGHRQLVLQLGGSADGPQLREEQHRRSVEVALLAWLQQAAGPQEQRELERLWVLFLSALELFLQDLCYAHHLCCIFSPGVGGVTPLRTGLEGWRGGGPELPPAPPCLEEEMEQVRAMLVEMESTANIPLWTVESMHVVGPGEGTAPMSYRLGPAGGRKCRVEEDGTPCAPRAASSACVFSGLSMLGSGDKGRVRGGSEVPAAPMPSTPTCQQALDGQQDSAHVI